MEEASNPPGICRCYLDMGNQISHGIASGSEIEDSVVRVGGGFRQLANYFVPQNE